MRPATPSLVSGRRFGGVRSLVSFERKIHIQGFFPRILPATADLPQCGMSCVFFLAVLVVLYKMQVQRRLW